MGEAPLLLILEHSKPEHDVCSRRSFNRTTKLLIEYRLLAARHPSADKGHIPRAWVSYTRTCQSLDHVKSDGEVDNSHKQTVHFYLNTKDNSRNVFICQSVRD